MKKLNFLKCISIFTVFVFSFSSSSNANWEKSDQNPNTQQTQLTPNTPNSQYTPHLNSDSLPKGVSKDWLDDLRDENGNRISNGELDRTPIQLPEDPQEDALQRKVFNGLSAGSNFGYSVSSAGDVNGDGYDDIIIGAYLYNSNTGRAYIYFGGVNLNTVADVILTGEAASTVFGCAVSTAGDVNGDGFSDVIVGAYGYSSNKGRAYIYYGGTVMNNTADVTLTGELAGNDFGTSVSTAGDVNGDGYSDVIAGADFYSSNTGRAYIYYGGSPMNNVADVTMTGTATFNTFGKSVSSAGDVNADGFSDVIVGANGYNSNTGRAYILFGGTTMNNVADVILTGEAPSNNFGVSVSSAGDIDGDGFSDVIAGAYGYNSNAGKAYVYFGGASMNSAPDVTMKGESSFNFFGNSVSSAGDMNGDGFTDIIVGAFGNNSFTGKAYVYFGGTSMDTVVDINMAGETAGSSFGISVAAAGDVNGDGFSEVIAGAYGYNSNTGRAYFYDYYLKNEITPELTMTGDAVNDHFGRSIASAGDVNGDGYSDIIIGAPYNNLVTGKTYIYFGGTSYDNIADVVLTGLSSGSFFGNSVSSAGDVNGDGYSDVIVGAYFYNSQTGCAYIFLGGVSMDNTADVILTGEITNSNFGISVSSAGDRNADGYSDIIVGASRINANDGKAYIYYGGESMNNTPDETMYGTFNSGETFGCSVSTAGDLNSDGYSDVIIGAYVYNTYRGRAIISFGGGRGNVNLIGEGINNFYGISVSTAGDVNADGYSDVIVGASGYNSGSGATYIYFGGISMDSLSDVVIKGTGYRGLGISVSSACDLNQDGYSDVIAGSYGVSVGFAYIFYGGNIMDSEPDASMHGETNNDYFGEVVSSAGDINGDGYSDLISGAYDFNSGTGRAYIYTGSAISIKPILLYAKDVPNDQGGYVDLKWARSSYDVNGTDIITEYAVERSLPPSGGNFAWVNIASIPAGKNSFYSHLASTPYDSTSNNSGTFFFRITAKTNSPSQYWRSAILSGRSLDNISPPVVSPFNAFSESVNVRLTWKRSTAPDLLNYVLFRSVSPSIDPYTETPLTSLSDSTYLDTSPLSGLYYYFIVAQDIHNNYSPVAVTQGPVTAKNLFLFGAIQGLYDPAADEMIDDTVTVYLRNTVSPFAKIDSSKKELYGPGTGQYFSFNNAQNNTPYYIEVKHRNALETWNADPVTFVSDAASIAFSVDAFYAYGNNQIQVDNDPYNVFAFYSGDVNQDGYIDLTDVLSIYNGANNFLTGYVVTDLTGDSIVDLTDILMAYNNSAKFVSVIRP